jgi:hypothetical protein
MNDQSLSDRLAALAVVILLILTAWGNALAMLVVSLLGLLVGFLFFGKSIAKGGALVATVGFAMGVAMAVAKLLRLG